MTGEPNKLEVFGVVADHAYPEKGPFFRSDAERRRFLAALRQRDLADRAPLLKGQRRRVWLARARAFWQAHSPEVIAGLITGAAIGLMGLPMETGILVLVSVLAFGGCYGFVWLCTEIRREWREQDQRRREKDGRP